MADQQADQDGKINNVADSHEPEDLLNLEENNDESGSIAAVKKEENNGESVAIAVEQDKSKQNLKANEKSNAQASKQENPKEILNNAASKLFSDYQQPLEVALSFAYSSFSKLAFKEDIRDLPTIKNDLSDVKATVDSLNKAIPGLKVAIEADLKTNADSITKKIEEVKNALPKDVSADVVVIKTQVAKIEATINTFEKDLIEKVITPQNNDLKSKIEQGNTKAEELGKTLKNMEQNQKAMLENQKAMLEIQKAMQENQKKVLEEIGGLKKSIEKVEKETSKKIAEVKTVVDSISSKNDAIKSTVDQISKSDLPQIKNDIVSSIQTAEKNITTKVAGVSKDIKDAQKSIEEKVSSAEKSVSKKVDDAKTAIVTAINASNEATAASKKDLVGKISDAEKNVKECISEVVSSKVKEAKDELLKSVNGVSTKIDETSKDIKSSLTNEIDKCSKQVKDSEESIKSLIPRRFIAIVLLIIFAAIIKIAITVETCNHSKVAASLTCPQVIVKKQPVQPRAAANNNNPSVSLTVNVDANGNQQQQQKGLTIKGAIADKLVVQQGKLITFASLPGDVAFIKKAKVIEKIEAQLQASGVNANPSNVAIYIARPSERLGEISNEHRANIETLLATHGKVILVAFKDADNCEMLPKFEYPPAIRGLHKVGFFMCHSDGAFNENELINKNTIAKLKSIILNE